MAVHGSRVLQVKCEADPTAAVAANLRPADPRLASGLLHVKRENTLQVKRESADAGCTKSVPPAPAPALAVVSIDLTDDDEEAAPSLKNAPPPLPSADGQLSSMIMNSLKRLQPGTAPAAVAPQVEVGQMLMNSLRALGADALRTSAAGNGLLCAVQQMHAAPLSAAALQQLPKPVMVKQELLQTKQELTAVKQELHSAVKQEKAEYVGSKRTDYPTEIMSGLLPNKNPSIEDIPSDPDNDNPSTPFIAAPLEAITESAVDNEKPDQPSVVGKLLSGNSAAKPFAVTSSDDNTVEKQKSLTPPSPKPKGKKKSKASNAKGNKSNSSPGSPPTRD